MNTRTIGNMAWGLATISLGCAALGVTLAALGVQLAFRVEGVSDFALVVGRHLGLVVPLALAALGAMLLFASRRSRLGWLLAVGSVAVLGISRIPNLMSCVEGSCVRAVADLTLAISGS